MNTRNEIKITFGTPKFIIYGDFTKCSMNITVKLPPVLEALTTTLIDKGYISPLPKIAKGMATVHPGDEYNEKTGIKIATAKAEIAAYIAVNNWLAAVADILFDSCHTKIDDFMIKADRVVRHDDNYVGSF